ncbi:MAG: sugar transferase [Caldilineaceae bacterium]|jgi:lipopolysaccharide/colanic/teichoic acid biosynthesis glycosyltransferase/glycosyltransferase involved in cell wall biosynthesis|nr:sugar transferase [Caldilineaceae bacterium]
MHDLMPFQVTLVCSVVIPVYNGSTVITRCLDALANQTVTPDRYELLVVDDGSTDATAAVVEEWRLAHPHICLALLHQANAGPAAARNLGAKHANAPLLFFTDADCAPTPTWLEALAAPFTDPDVAGAKGAYVTEQRAAIPRFVQAEYEDRYDRMRGQLQIDFIDTYSAAYRRSIFLENKGFDPIFTTASVEDQEFSFRLAQKGYRLVFAPDARVSHLHDGDLGDYFRRKYYIGFWKALMIRWHPERMVQDSHTPQVLKVQIVLLAAIFGLATLALLGALWAPLTWSWVGVAVAILIFLATTLPFTLKLARRSPALAIVGPGMVMVRALALGSGYLNGTIHFAGTLPGAHQPVITGWQRLVKRSMDILGALVGLAISIPLVAVAALAIKLDSPGPVFFWQVRVGENGRSFRIIKLRTMSADAEEKLGNLVDITHLEEPVFKLKQDPRVTRVGRLLRRTSLDEAPQFYNVLRGDMSLVGPRPEEERIVQLYQDYHRRRLAVKPGMTGPMQVSGRGDLGFAERLQLELDYIEHYSLRRDLEILLRTFPAIFHGDGAH